MLVSTSTHGGHVDIIGKQGAGGRRRRLHSDEFKANAVAAVAQPGISTSAVALSLGINANLLRRWMRDAEIPQTQASRTSEAAVPTGVSTAKFVPVQLPAPEPLRGDIRLELRRGGLTVAVTGPVASAGECASWMRELLR